MDIYYQDEWVTLYCGDSLDFQAEERPALLATDIPYNISQSHNGLREINFGRWDYEFDVGGAIDWFHDGIPNVYIWCAAEQLSILLGGLKDTGYSTRALAWVKPNPSPMNGEYIWLSAMELCAFGKQPGAIFNYNCEPNWLKMNAMKDKVHPTQKPIELFHNIIRCSSRPGELVFDPYCGSGTTLRAAKDLGRRAIGVELNEEYCEIAATRLQQEVLPL